MKIKLLYGFFALCFFANQSFAYIGFSEKFIMKDGQQLLLLFDQPDFSLLDNQTNALNIIQAVKNVARSHQDLSIELSYQESGVYDAGEKLLEVLKYLKLNAAIADIINNSGIILLERRADTRNFDIMPGTKHAQSRSFLDGYFTYLLSLEENLPDNLKVRSNDPRKSQILALVEEENWLLNYGLNFSRRSLFMPSLLFKKKQFSFQGREFPLETGKPFRKILKKLHTTEQERLEKFCQPLALKSDNLTELIIGKENTFNLKVVAGFLKNTHPNEEAFAEAPIADVLLTMLSEKAPDIMVVILEAELARELSSILTTMKIVSQKTSHIPEELINSFLP